MPFEVDQSPENSNEIIGKNPEEALKSLEIRDELVIQEAEELGAGGVKCVEFCHRNEDNVSHFFSDYFTELPDLVLEEV